jgi:hypothetical protein
MGQLEQQPGNVRARKNKNMKNKKNYKNSVALVRE